MYYPKNDAGVCIYYLGIHQTYLRPLKARQFLGISADNIEVYENDIMYIDTENRIKFTFENKDLIPKSSLNKPIWGYSEKKGFYLSPIKTKGTSENIEGWLYNLGYRVGNQLEDNTNNTIVIRIIIEKVKVLPDKILINDEDINNYISWKKIYL